MIISKRVSRFLRSRLPSRRLLGVRLSSFPRPVTRASRPYPSLRPASVPWPTRWSEPSHLKAGPIMSFPCLNSSGGPHQGLAFRRWAPHLSNVVPCHSPRVTGSKAASLPLSRCAARRSLCSSLLNTSSHTLLRSTSAFLL